MRHGALNQGRVDTNHRLTRTNADLVPRLLDLMQGLVAHFPQTVGHLTDISQLEHTEAPETVGLTAIVRGVRRR